MLLKDFIDFNPKESLSKDFHKKISMDQLKPFQRYINSDNYEMFSSGSKFRNGDTIMARITPCLENGKTAYVNCLASNEVAFGSTEFIVARAKEGISLPLFIYYLLCSTPIRNTAILSMTGSSGRERVQQFMLDNYEIPYYSLEFQQHIVDTIGSVDSLIEKYEEIILKTHKLIDDIYLKETNNLELVKISELDYFSISKSGITKFENNKIYLDTAAVSSINITDETYIIDYENRPSRANMQPKENTIWFAKLKDSPKYILVKNQKRLLENFILSTGFMGLESEEYIVNYLYTLILSTSFTNQKNLLSNGATMQGINNEIFMNILVPKVDKTFAKAIGKNLENHVNLICRLQEKKYKLKQIKEKLLQKYFG